MSKGTSSDSVRQIAPLTEGNTHLLQVICLSENLSIETFLESVLIKIEL